ncbi:MAG: hypothetical protein H0U71_00035 [Gammaproteobacteria bacterium]|nr:hypothetical protein [Gammaproteobacteria bacterium]
MKKILTKSIFAVLILGPCSVAFGDDSTAGFQSSVSAPAATENVSPSTQNADAAREMADNQKRAVEEAQKKAEEDAQKKADELTKKRADELAQKKAEEAQAQTSPAPTMRSNSRVQYTRPYTRQTAPVRTEANDENRVTVTQHTYRERPSDRNTQSRNEESRSQNSFSTNVRDSRDGSTTSVVHPTPRVQVEQRRGFVSDVTSTVNDVRSGKITSVTHDRDTESQFRQRELRERELRARDWQIKERENRLKDRDYRMSHRERALSDREWYNGKLKVREWDDIYDRDQELSYLIWRERQLSRYFWSENNRVCRYVTYYQTGVRVNRRVTVCEWRRGEYTCFHPKRYFIYPVTKLVCYGRNDRRAVGAIVRPYPY